MATPLPLQFRLRFDHDPVLNPTLGAKLAAEGRELSYSNAEAKDQSWPRIAMDAVIRVAKRLRIFTTDDVWVELLHESDGINKSALGGVMNRAAKLGYISRQHGVEGIPSKRPSRHCSMLRVWVSNIYEGGH